MARQHSKVVAIYKEMKERQIHCNTITFNTMLNAMARCGMMHEVPQLLQDMQESSPPVVPDIVTYSTVIKGYCHSGDLDKALELLDHMKIVGDCQPDEVLYNSLLDGCAKQQRLDQALVLLAEMKEMKVPPSNYTLSIICKVFGRARRLEQAFSMVASASQEFAFKPNIQVYTCLMQACFHNRQVQRAIDLHDQVVSEGHCSPDEKTYTVIVRGCLQSCAPDKAAQVIRCAFHLPNHGLQQTKGRPQGVELACLEEVLAELGPQSPSAQALAKELKEHSNITVSEASSIFLNRPRQQGARSFRQRGN
jgi:pentatricopeptide repeat protein